MLTREMTQQCVTCGVLIQYVVETSSIDVLQSFNLCNGQPGEFRNFGNRH